MGLYLDWLSDDPRGYPASDGEALPESLRRLRSGSQQRLIIPRTRLRSIGDRSFHGTAARAWNSLPTSVTTAPSLASFKNQLKHFFS